MFQGPISQTYNVFMIQLFFRCLTENGWDLNRATEAFNNAQREGKIPLNAFEK